MHFNCKSHLWILRCQLQVYFVSANDSKEKGKPHFGAVDVTVASIRSASTNFRNIVASLCRRERRARTLESDSN